MARLFAQGHTASKSRARTLNRANSVTYSPHHLDVCLPRGERASQSSGCWESSWAGPLLLLSDLRPGRRGGHTGPWGLPAGAWAEMVVLTQFVPWTAGAPVTADCWLWAPWQPCPAVLTLEQCGMLPLALPCPRRQASVRLRMGPPSSRQLPALASSPLIFLHRCFSL